MFPKQRRDLEVLFVREPYARSVYNQRETNPFTRPLGRMLCFYRQATTCVCAACWISMVYLSPSKQYWVERNN